MMRPLRKRCSTSIRRTPVCCASLVVGYGSPPVRGPGPDAAGHPRSERRPLRGRLGDGSLIVAHIAEQDQARVVLITLGGGRLEIDRSQIPELRPARGRIVNDEFWSEDPGGTWLFFTGTGRSLNRGES